jgi:hypothetical protein
VDVDGGGWVTCNLIVKKNVSREKKEEKKRTYRELETQMRPEHPLFIQVLVLVVVCVLSLPSQFT